MGWRGLAHTSHLRPLATTLGEKCSLALPLLAAGAVGFPGAAGGIELSFERTYVDLAYGGNGRPGWVRAGDMDNDGDLDIVAGGGYALYVYENDGTAGGWTRHGNLDGTGQIGANGGVLFDADGDDDLDVVCAKYTDDLGWWENPGGALTTTAWTFHTIRDESRYLHDLLLADLDQDGVKEELVANLNQGYWNARITIRWLRPGADPTQPWEAHTIEADRPEGAPHGHAGLDVADVDGDGHVDLAYSNGWYEAPDDPAGAWTWHEITTLYGISNALLRDMNEDGDLDLVVSAGHHGSGVYWLEAPEDPIAGAWTQHAIDPDVHHPECLAVLDLWGDGDPDVVSCDLFFGEAPGEPGWDEEVHNVYVFQNLGSAASWSTQSIAPNSYPSHLLQMADMNGDGKMDIISEATGTSVVTYYENTSTVPDCQDDLYEPDDLCTAAAALPAGALRSHFHCDPDWFEIATTDGATYEIETSALVGGADTELELYGPGCSDFVASDDDSGVGLASRITWTATYTGAYRAVSRQAGYLPGEGYSIRARCILDCGLCSAPDQLVLQNDTVGGLEQHEACSSITVGPAYEVLTGGTLELRAGTTVVFRDGFAAREGATVTVEIDPSLQ